MGNYERWSHGHAQCQFGGPTAIRPKGVGAWPSRKSCGIGKIVSRFRSPDCAPSDSGIAFAHAEAISAHTRPPEGPRAGRLLWTSPAKIKLEARAGFFPKGHRGPYEVAPTVAGFVRFVEAASCRAFGNSSRRNSLLRLGLPRSSPVFAAALARCRARRYA